MAAGMRTRQLIKLLFKGLTHPVSVFVLLQIVWVAVLILWVIRFISQEEAVSQLAHNLGEKEIDATYGIVFLTIGCVLLGIILLGTVMLFVFTQKQASFLKQQKSFVSSVTHELRSPLASLQLSFETLQKPNVPKDVLNHIYHMVTQDIDRLVQLVDRILISSRLDRGIVELDQSKEPVNIAEIIHLVIQRAKHLDQELESRVHITCPSDLWAQISKTGMNLILSNLLENAIKYSKTNQPIRVMVSHHQDKLMFTVEDEGVGLTPYDIRRIFKMFYRSETATKKAVKGTGLGLFIVKSTVQLMGGTVWAESEGQGKGTCFYVLVPVQSMIGGI